MGCQLRMVTLSVVNDLLTKAFRSVSSRAGSMTTSRTVLGMLCACPVWTPTLGTEQRDVCLQMNMFALNNMASVESVLGRPLYTFIYLTTGVAGAFASFIFSRAPSLGASGAVLGIFGACWMYFENNKPYMSKGARQIQASIQQVILLNLGIGFFIAKVDNWCALPLTQHYNAACCSFIPASEGPCSSCCLLHVDCCVEDPILYKDC